jgi:hypothetical protein
MLVDLADDMLRALIRAIAVEHPALDEEPPIDEAPVRHRAPEFPAPDRVTSVNG